MAHIFKLFCVAVSILLLLGFTDAKGPSYKRDVESSNAENNEQEVVAPLLITIGNIANSKPVRKVKEAGNIVGEEIGKLANEFANELNQRAKNNVNKPNKAIPNVVQNYIVDPALVVSKMSVDRATNHFGNLVTDVQHKYDKLSEQEHSVPSLKPLKNAAFKSAVLGVATTSVLGGKLRSLIRKPSSFWNDDKNEHYIKMNILAYILLPCVLLVSQKATVAAAIDLHIDSENEFAREPLPRTNSTTIESDGSYAVDLKDSKNGTPKLTTAFNVISKGNELKKQYGFLIPKLASMMLPGGLSMNPFRLISFLPYVMLALQKVNAPPPETDTTLGQNGNWTFGINNLNLASTLENPKTLKRLFSVRGNGDLAIDSVKLLAGPNASTIVDKLVDEVKQNASNSKDGVSGINGEKLVAALKNSDTFKKLFPTDELTNEGLNFMNAYMDSILSQELKNVKNEVVTDVKDLKSSRSNDQSVDNSVTGVIRGTLSDSVAVFFKVGRRKINEKLQSLASDAEKNVADWKQTPGDGNSNFSPPGWFKNMILNYTPNAILKFLATGNVLKNQYGNPIPQLATYFLPVGVGMDALKFVCLVTYVMLMARKENIIPDKGMNGVKMPGLNTERIIDTLNDKETMKKIFPLRDHSNVAIVMLKFLAGPEAIIMDKLVDEIKKMNAAKGDNQPLNKLSLLDLIKNSEFFKKLFTMKEYADDKMKNYFGMDFGQLKNGTVNEMKNNNSENDGENASAGLFRKAAVLAPKSVLYGLAGGTVTANKFGSLFQKADSALPNNNGIIVITSSNESVLVSS